MILASVIILAMLAVGAIGSLITGAMFVFKWSIMLAAAYIVFRIGLALFRMGQRDVRGK